MTSLIPFKCWIPWALKKHRNPDLTASFIYDNIRNGLKTSGQVKPRRGTAELSLIVIDGLNSAVIQRLGTSIRKKDPKPVVGWAEIRPGDLSDREELSVLRFEIDYCPVARHGNLLGCPTDDEKRLALAHELAMVAVGIVYDA